MDFSKAVRLKLRRNPIRQNRRPRTLYDLGADWYATRFDVEWPPATAGEAEALFAKHGFRGPFWSLAPSR